MRSPFGIVLVILGVAAVAVMLLVVLQSMTMRDELRQARDEVAALQARVETIETVSPDDLVRELEVLESGIRDWLIATGADGFDPDASQTAGGGTGDDDRTTLMLARIDEVLARIDALDERLDEICEGVPIC
jgi:hypothetical protein